MAVDACAVKGTSLVGEFDDLTDEQIAPIITDINLELDVTTCPELADTICKFMVAHEIVMRRRAGIVSSGPVAGESAGGVSRSYRTSGLVDKSAMAQYFGQTAYGQKVLRLFRIIPVTPLAVCTVGEVEYKG